jgi:hypothetical protein
MAATATSIVKMIYRRYLFSHQTTLSTPPKNQNLGLGDEGELRTAV